MGTVVNIQRYSLGDGPGIRTTVFLKGCPLRCLWCSNPETQKAKPEVGHRESLCHHCGKCLAACKNGAIAIVDGRIHIDHEKCISCGGCVDACLYGSMTWYGMEMSAEEVVSAVRQDEMFYGAQGGVTLSGGEVLMQAEFAAAILSGCREAGIHTAIETSGFGGGLERLLPLLDLLIFDLKAGSSALHKRLTGVPNEIIRQNLALAAESGVEVLVRYPMIPGYNDAEQDGIAAIMNDCGLSRVEIMPYHNTVIHYHAIIRKALQSAVKKDILPKNPADRVERPKKNVFHGNFYSEDEMLTLFDAVSGDPLELCVKITAYYGLRRSEVLGLRWSAIDLEHKTISISHKVIEKQVDGKFIPVGEDVLKTKSSFRTLPLIPAVEKLLLAEKEKQEMYRHLFRKAYSRDYLDYICVDQTGKLLRPNYVTEHFSWLIEKYGLRKVRFHDLRHTCASLLLSSGISMKQIQIWLGHSTFATTADIYAHLDYSAQEASANAMSGMFNKEPKCSET